MRYPIFLGCLLSLVWVSAWATNPEESEEREKMKMEEMHSRGFQKLDENSDQKISQEEFQKATQKRFDHLDEDNDGFISQEEWQSSKQKMKERMKEHHRRMMEEMHEEEGMSEE